jgi:hypothetical protein
MKMREELGALRMGAVAVPNEIQAVRAKAKGLSGKRD